MHEWGRSIKREGETAPKGAQEGQRETPTQPWERLELASCEIITWAEIRSQTLNQTSEPPRRLNTFIKDNSFFCKIALPCFCFFFALFFLKLFLQPVWGSNSGPRDQESHALLTEQARRPCLGTLVKKSNDPTYKDLLLDSQVYSIDLHVYPMLVYAIFIIIALK